MTVASLIAASAARLKRARIEEPRLEAESLLAYLLRRTQEPQTATFTRRV